MKPLLSLLFAVLLAPSLSAQAPPDDPQAGTLVDCGNEKVAIFERTESRDGRFALGWTVRPNRKKDPVDWSTYQRDDPLAFLEKYPDDVEKPDAGDYVLVNGVLDLRAKTFVPLPGKDPYFPGYNHHGLAVAWSEERNGARYALVSNDSRFSTDELFLVRLGAGPVWIVDLSPEADKAVAKRMRRRDPKDYRDYETTYDPRSEADSGTPRTEFRKNSVTVHFDTGVPKSEVNTDAGKITFALPKGNVLRIDFDKK